jgi:hypothetical protein
MLRRGMGAMLRSALALQVWQGKRHIDTNCLFGRTSPWVQNACSEHCAWSKHWWAQYKWHAKIHMQSLKPQNWSYHALSSHFPSFTMCSTNALRKLIVIKFQDVSDYLTDIFLGEELLFSPSVFQDLHVIIGYWQPIGILKNSVPNNLLKRFIKTTLS